MSVLRWAAAAALGSMAVAASPASAQFYLKSKDLTGKPVRGDEPGILAMALPGATPEELRAGLSWTMRAGLNVAALQCQFEPSLNAVRNYNALLTDHRDELQRSFTKLTGYFNRTAKTKAEGQRALDQFSTRTYSSFSATSAQRGFCQTANALGLDANFTPRGHFGEFSETRMQELRNSLIPFGEQLFPMQYVVHSLRVAQPRMDRICWSKKGEWQTKKCGAPSWISPNVAYAAR
ncbi:MAG TPA: hypothetical protein VF636_01625 [Sphingomonas sp.]|jgi:hypothetical protein